MKKFVNKELGEWLASFIEYQCNGFYGGCRMDAHSPQVREFCDHLHYYLEKDLGYVSERRKLCKKRDYQHWKNSSDDEKELLKDLINENTFDAESKKP